MIKIWIGRRESDILTYMPNKFDYSISYYGSNNQKNNFSFDRQKRTFSRYNKDFYCFIIKCIEDICNDRLDYELYFYNNILSRELENLQPSLKNHFRNCNNYSLIDWLNNKSYSRLWLSNSVNVPPFALLSKDECHIDNLSVIFPHYSEYIIQKNYSSGGKGTYHLTSNNENIILNQLSSSEPYLASPYIANAIAACCHVIIGSKNVIVFPIGFQILSEHMDTMTYLGTTYQKPNHLRITDLQIEEFILKISHRLACNGYRGICGYDFLIQEKQLILIEINPRYMASSYLLNYVLAKENLPSLFDLNDMAFSNDMKLGIYQKQIYNLNIPYVTKTAYYNETKTTSLPSKYILLFNDGLDNAYAFENNAYMYRYIDKY